MTYFQAIGFHDEPAGIVNVPHERAARAAWEKRNKSWPPAARARVLAFRHVNLVELRASEHWPAAMAVVQTTFARQAKEIPLSLGELRARAEASGDADARWFFALQHGIRVAAYVYGREEGLRAMLEEQDITRDALERESKEIEWWQSAIDATSLEEMLAICGLQARREDDGRLRLRKIDDEDVLPLVHVVREAYEAGCFAGALAPQRERSGSPPLR